MAFSLTDDGTMDTVVRCDECGEELRYNYDPSTEDDDDDDRTDDDRYDAFVEWCLEDAESEHECARREDTPEDEDIFTEDYRTFRYLGKVIAEVPEDVDDWRPIVGAWCKKNAYFPNVWCISDHGNAHLISVSEDGRYLAGYADDEVQK